MPDSLHHLAGSRLGRARMEGSHGWPFLDWRVREPVDAGGSGRAPSRVRRVVVFVFMLFWRDSPWVMLQRRRCG